MLKGYINNASEVSDGLGLRVAASLPKYHAGPLGYHHWFQGRRQRWNETWRSWRDESVDALAARLLRKTDQEPMRVLMISSAMPDEGKESLSTDLAVSMARKGRRTVLVDFNLREPWLSEEFEKRYGMPLDPEPGVSEVLLGRADLPAVIQRVSDELSLAVITAGRADPTVIALLSEPGDPDRRTTGRRIFRGSAHRERWRELRERESRQPDPADRGRPPGQPVRRFRAPFRAPRQEPRAPSPRGQRDSRGLRRPAHRGRRDLQPGTVVRRPRGLRSDRRRRRAVAAGR